jgi:AcrR family transcriptional regulator
VSSPQPERGDSSPIWARPAPGERKPAHSRERIAAAALKIADAEGFEAVTMRRVASELGAGTMTLYHYVRNKRELAALMDDAVMGELLVPADELADDWREGLAQIARRTYRVFMNHPWTFEFIGGEDDPGVGGPNALHHVEQSLLVVEKTGLDLKGQFDITALVDDYVFGHAMRARGIGRSREAPQQRFDAIIAYMETQLATGDYPRLQAIAGDDIRGGFARVAELTTDPDRFERGLRALLDGIELMVARAK